MHGMLGLGLMRRNFLLNMADHGCAVADLEFTAMLRKLFEPLSNRRYVDYVWFLSMPMRFATRKSTSSTLFVRFTQKRSIYAWCAASTARVGSGAIHG
jgi:hypothetical protein